MPAVGSSPAPAMIALMPRSAAPAQGHHPVRCSARHNRYSYNDSLAVSTASHDLHRYGCPLLSR